MSGERSYMRKRMVFCLVILCLCTVLSSCRGIDDDPPKQPQQTPLEKAGITPTEEELMLLIARYSSDDRIMRGDLKSYEVEAIIDYRCGMSYLKNKYPGNEFIPIAIGPSTVWTPWTEIGVQCVGGRNFTVKVHREQDGSRRCSDNYF